MQPMSEMYTSLNKQFGEEVLCLRNCTFARISFGEYSGRVRTLRYLEMMLTDFGILYVLSF